MTSAGMAALIAHAARHTALTFDAATVWPAANRAIYVPIELPVPVVVQKAFWVNGATVNGNVDAGVYDSSGAKLAAIGSTAQAGASALQSATLSTTLAAGRYWLALASSSGTATFWASAVDKLLSRVCGVQEEDTAFALPATATFANPTANFVPFVGLAMRSVVQVGAPSLVTPLYLSSASFFTPSWDTHPAGGSMSTFFNNNRSLYCPISIPYRYPVRRIFVQIASGAGNYDVGIYSAGGARIFSIGSTSTTGLPAAIAYTTVSPDLILSPGTYYLGIAASSNACSFASLGGTVVEKRATGWLMESAFPLPASMTPVVIPASENMFPIFGVTRSMTI